MPKSRPPYRSEFCRQMAARLRADRTTEGVAHEFAPSARAIRNWVRRVDRDEGRREDGLTSAEREETRWLRREEKQLSLKREIPAKAAAWFAREIDSIPPAPSSS